MKNKEQEDNLVRNQGIQVAILGHVAVDPTLSTQKLTTKSGVTQTSAHRTLYSHHFYSHKIHLLQGLYADDFYRRLQFCELMTNQTLEKRIFRNLVGCQSAHVWQGIIFLSLTALLNSSTEALVR